MKYVWFHVRAKLIPVPVANWSAHVASQTRPLESFVQRHGIHQLSWLKTKGTENKLGMKIKR